MEPGRHRGYGRANLAHGLGHGPIGALVSAWPALALVGSFELLMLLIRSGHQVGAEHSTGIATATLAHDEPRKVLSLEQVVQERRNADHSQRAIARDLNIDRRKAKQILDRDAA